MSNLGRYRCLISEIGGRVARAALVLAIALAVAAPGQEVVLQPGHLCAAVVERVCTHGFLKELNAPGGSMPRAGLVYDANTGNLYGTTTFGGKDSSGVIYKIDSSGKFGRVAQFKRNSPTGRFLGIHPNALTVDKMGNLYGTTVDGGPTGLGVIFMYSPTTNTYMATALGFLGTDGTNPIAGVVLNQQTNTLYGTTLRGGVSNNGTVFALDNTFVNLTYPYQFTGGADGGAPAASVILDKEGNIYGTTMNGGMTGGNCGNTGCGVVFKIDLKRKIQMVLHRFTGGVDGGFPMASLLIDSVGNLYGTAMMGGKTGGACGTLGCGVVFMIDKNKKHTVLYSFGGRDGKYPRAELTFGPKNSVYGTTERGGRFGKGTVFKLDLSIADLSTTNPVVHDFTGGKDGKLPLAGLLLHKGRLYGTASAGGNVHVGPFYHCCRGTAYAIRNPSKSVDQ